MINLWLSINFQFLISNYQIQPSKNFPEDTVFERLKQRPGLITLSWSILSLSDGSLSLSDGRRRYWILLKNKIQSLRNRWTDSLIKESPCHTNSLIKESPCHAHTILSIQLTPSLGTRMSRSKPICTNLTGITHDRDQLSHLCGYLLQEDKEL